MYYADIKEYDVANGPGVRMSLFVSGCPHHCKNCFNEETWDFNYGKKFETETWVNIINSYYEKRNIYSGFTILGGEPMHPRNIVTVRYFIERLKEVIPDVNIWIYTGYTLEELYHLYNDINRETTEFDKEYFHILINMIDVLVDGRFVEEEKDLSIKFRGSRNQRIIDVKSTILHKKIICIPDNEI